MKKELRKEIAEDYDLRNEIARLRAELAELANMYKREHELNTLLANDKVMLTAKLTKAEEALEKLARLGNGTQYGNSDGNMIARNYLEGK